MPYKVNFPRVVVRARHVSSTIYFQGNAPDEDPREKAMEKKRESVAKNELQRLRNIARQKKVKLPSVGVAPIVNKQSKGQDAGELKKAADLAHVSTASLGKFQAKLTGAMEKTAAKGGKGGTGKKRKFTPLVSAGEKEKSLKLLEKMGSKKPKIDLEQAVNKAIHEEETERSKQKAAAGGKGKKGGKKGGGGKGRFSKKGGHQSGGKKGSAGGKRRGAKGKQ